MTSAWIRAKKEVGLVFPKPVLLSSLTFESVIEPLSNKIAAMRYDLAVEQETASSYRNNGNAKKRLKEKRNRIEAGEGLLLKLQNVDKRKSRKYYRILNEAREFIGN